MSRRIPLALLAAGALVLTGCGAKKNEDQPVAAPPVAAPATSAAASADSSPSSATSNSALPDICTLITKAEVTELTGESVTLMTDEGGKSENTRYCQWQLSVGQVTIMVSVDTRDDFDVRNKQAKSVAGVGEAAYSLAGHLYVFENGRTTDVYVSSESSDAANLAVEKKAADKILTKLSN
jgi:hypothetical protein